MVPGSPTGDAASGWLARGWVPSPRLRAAVLVAVGLLLVAHALVGGLPAALGLSAGVDYHAVEVTPAGDDLAFEPVGDEAPSVGAGFARTGGPTLLDCYPFGSDATCVLETQLTDAALTVDAPPEVWHGYTHHDRFYERVATDRGDAVELALRPLPARAVLANVSVPAREWSAPIRTAVEAGRVAADPSLPLAGAVLERAGSFYVVFPASSAGADESTGAVGRVLTGMLGVLVARRGVSRYRE
jgi:hypothetical protein